jgi:predicted GIY-YIG superfamily endonuclease
MMALSYCVNILFSHKDHLLYTGYTTNIEERINNHNEGKSKSTAPRRPLRFRTITSQKQKHIHGLSRKTTS